MIPRVSLALTGRIFTHVSVAGASAFSVVIVTSGERYITQELKELESKILGAHERLITLERRLFDELLESISAQLDRIQRTANAVAKLDVLTALAQVAAENNYCRPVVDDSDELTITEGRHPVVEQVLKGSLFVPNDTTLNCGEDRCLNQ